jgi:hypothetical protein
MHPSAIVENIGNLVAATISTGNQTGRTINFQDWPAPSYASSSPATTASNCTFAVGTFGNTTTNAYACIDAADTWTYGSRDRAGVLTRGGPATSAPQFAWAATMMLQ